MRASLSVITPLEVDNMAIPKPFNTRGRLVEPAYLRKPGLLIRAKLRIADIFVIGWYFKATLIVPSALAYGAYGSGSIPAYTSLVFDIEITNVQ